MSATPLRNTIEGLCANPDTAKAIFFPEWNPEIPVKLVEGVLRYRVKVSHDEFAKIFLLYPNAFEVRAFTFDHEAKCYVPGGLLGARVRSGEVFTIEEKRELLRKIEDLHTRLGVEYSNGRRDGSQDRHTRCVALENVLRRSREDQAKLIEELDSLRLQIFEAQQAAINAGARVAQSVRLRNDDEVEALVKALKQSEAIRNESEAGLSAQRQRAADERAGAVDARLRVDKVEKELRASGAIWNADLGTFTTKREREMFERLKALEQQKAQLEQERDAARVGLDHAQKQLTLYIGRFLDADKSARLLNAHIRDREATGFKVENERQLRLDSEGYSPKTGLFGSPSSENAGKGRS